jgi:hypothetical protein
MVRASQQTEIKLFGVVVSVTAQLRFVPFLRSDGFDLRDGRFRLREVAKLT